jgi:heme/copper-type cytochrome/quinol oxidase subunit 4
MCTFSLFAAMLFRIHLVRGVHVTNGKQNKINIDCVGIQVLTAVVMKCSIIWYITPCSPLKVCRRFRGTFRRHLQGK